MNTRESTATHPHDGHVETTRVGEGVADFIPRLEAAAAAVDDAKEALRLHYRHRHLLAVEAVDAGVSQRAVARALGIAQSRVIRLLGSDPGDDD